MLTIATARKRLTQTKKQPASPVTRQTPPAPIRRKGHPFVYSVVAGSVLLGGSAYLFGAVLTVLGLLAPSMLYVAWSALVATNDPNTGSGFRRESRDL